MHSLPRYSVAFIAVGANIDPEQNIGAALAALQEVTRVVASSTFYRTDPVGRPDRPKFVNGVWRIETDLPPRAVRGEVLRPIEDRLGRRRTADKFAPRTIDLDLVLYDDRVVADADLVLPHPDIQRAFVYTPVVELLAGMAPEDGPGLPARIAALLPQGVSVDEPGEVLEALTKQLRQMICR